MHANLWRYVAFQSLWTADFFVPVIVLFWQENGLDAQSVFWLQALFALAVVVLEVPTGMVADRMGKRTSLLVGTTLLTAGFVAYGLGRGFFSFLAGEIVLATGVTFISGADSALLYDTLKLLGRSDDYRRLEGRAKGMQLVALAIGCVIGGFIGARSTRATLWLSAAGPALAAAIVWGMVEARAPAEAGDASARRDSHTTAYWRLIKDSLRLVRKHQLVRWYILFAAVLSGSSTWLLWLYQPYMELTGLPIVVFGLAFAAFNLFAALASRLAYRVDAALGGGRSLGALAALQVLPPFLMAVALAPIGVVFVLGHQAVRGMAGVLLSDRILRYVYADKRATVLSLSSLAGRLFFAMTAPLVGWAAKNTTMRTTLLLQAGALVVIFLVLSLLYGRIPRKYFQVKESVQLHS